MEFPPFPKLKTYRNKKFLDWVKSKPCLACGSVGVDPHHMATGGTGLKCSDLFCIPLCRKCHTLVEDGFWQLLELRYAFTESVAWRRVAEQMQEWFLKKGGENDGG